ncbi:MAG TPA: fasciclin domain-containing protein [Longimicrobiales bacterium]|nr:fasciclin domain-containing protein [Longimicrobiales bacterium]
MTIWRVLGAAAMAATLLIPGSRASGQEMGTKDIVDTAAAAGGFTTLLAAVRAAGLEETLRSAGPFTVFAPTDAAFAKLPAGTVEALLGDREQLAAILTYHVVAGRVMSTDVVTLESASTVTGESVDIRTVNGAVMIDGATVVKADVTASNGVIHVVDTVILPGTKK